ncbi:NACHT domain-containing protein [Laspinema sp. D3]|nr:NACHT domain-containing protein [Laspinema sp. D2c]
MTTTLNGIMCWGINQLPDKYDLGVPSEIIIGLTLCSVLGIVFFSSQPSESQNSSETTSVSSMWILGLLPALGSIILFLLIKDGHVPSEFSKAAGYASLFLFIAGTLLPGIIAFWKVQQPILVASAFGNSLNDPDARQAARRAARESVLKDMSTQVQARLTHSIHREALRLNLGKEQQPQQVQRPWDMSVKVGEQRSVQLPAQTTILDVFDNPTISGKFLILGKPGGGKTTTLLELAEALIERAEGDSDAPIPVILELSSWQDVTKREFPKVWEQKKYDPSIKEWVLSQLMSKGVSQEMGEQWLREKELVLLLDGLDELRSERQRKCVQAINQFLSSEFSPLHLVVCSRKEEYEVYEEMLHLNGAICLEDLTNEQIRHYFTSVNLGEFWESIKGSEKIVDFIRQPLFLAVTSLAYQQIDVEEWRNCNTEERAIDYLLGVYQVTMLKFYATNQRYSSALNIQSYLSLLSKYLDESESVIVYFLSPRKIFNLIFGKEITEVFEFFLLCICWIPCLLLLIYLSYETLNVSNNLYWDFYGFLNIIRSILSVASHLLVGLFLITLYAIVIVPIYVVLLVPLIITSNLDEIWVWTGEQRIEQDSLEFSIFLSKILFILFFFGYSFATSAGTDGFFMIIFLVLFLGVSIFPISWFYLSIFLFLKNIYYVSRVFLNMIFTSLFCFAYTFLLKFTLSWIYPPAANLTPANLTHLTPLMFSLYVGIVWAGGLDLIKYYLFRLILGLTGQMPWNITRFLDYCTERLILQRVGNRYRFIHRLVQEHFAKLEIQKE